MSYFSFEDLDVWKRGCRVAVEICSLLRDSREWGLRDQMIRAAISISSNIAEGAERSTPRDFARFLDVARGSAAELRTQLYIAVRAEMVSDQAANSLIMELKEISSMLYSLSQQQRAKVKEEDPSHFTLNTSHSPDTSHSAAEPR
ncbi:four helix bundle protein [Wenzhouxiangella sp. 15190]|uniref:four helix bundle protein n=1 Tax=unclassified Wenzhouxiangella TaxID=2613841 RepID=UPI000E327B52|nr:four helix bundle protein [Wenzhouxiangella sp. 15181]RFP68986.1 four helix bundle protein [Wenzhouxiangella sp. 15190]